MTNNPDNPTRYHITWMGSYTKRVKKGIHKVNPDYILFLLESSTERWKIFQEESLKEVLEDFGSAYDGHTDSIKIPHSIPHDELQTELFKRIFTKIRDQRMLDNDTVFTIDITAAPKVVTYVLTFITVALSTKNSKIKLLYTPKNPKSYPSSSLDNQNSVLDPSYYAPSASVLSLSENHKKLAEMTLAEYRNWEKLDPGGETLFVELPIADFEIFNVSSYKAPYLQSVFIQIPSSQSDPIPSYEIKKGVIKSNGKNLMKKKKVPEKGKQKSASTILTFALQQFEEWGIVKLSRRGRYFIAKRTWAGDMIHPAVVELYKSLESPTRENVIEESKPEK